jgi:apolipoprotein N-acyltransferase
MGRETGSLPDGDEVAVTVARKPRLPRWRPPALAGGAGLATAASLPPLGWWPLGIIGVGLLVPLSEFGARRAPTAPKTPRKAAETTWW